MLSPLGLSAMTLAQDLGLYVFPVYEPAGGGACICPKGSRCGNAGKHPRTANGFRDATTHPEAIAEWWNRWPNANIGVWPGGSRLLVVDVDGPAGEAAATAIGAFSVPTLESITARGLHRWFRLPADITIGNVTYPKLDVRSARGYVLAPPSIHRSGHVYQWRGPLDNIADAPTQLLAALCRNEGVNHDPNDDRLEPPVGGVELQALIARERGSSASIESLIDRADRRIRAYIEKVGPRAEGNRDNTAFRIARWLLNDFGVSETTALAYLVDWNQGNQPPLSVRELEAKLRSAARSGSRAPGCAHDPHHRGRVA